MGRIRTRFRLRTYLLMALLPSTLLPLALLAFFTHAFIKRSFDQEVARRARPEISAVSRNLDTLESRLLRQTLNLARSDAFRLAVLTKRPADLNGSLKPWFDASLVDVVRVYSFKGEFLRQMNKNTLESPGSPWKQLFPAAERRPARDSELPEEPVEVEEVEEDRTPANSRSNEGFTDAYRRYQNSLPISGLSSEFRAFLHREGSWVFRETSSENIPGWDLGEQIVLRVFRVVLDSDFKPAGFIEGFAVMNSAKWEHLARYQGVEFVVLGKDRRFLAGSTPMLKNISPAIWWGDLIQSRPVEIADMPHEFFFSPVVGGGDSSAPIAWLGVGISRAEQWGLQNRILFWMVALTAVLALIAIFITIWISNRVITPIQNLVDAAENLRTGQPTEALKMETTTETTVELAYLIDRFNEMTSSVQSTKKTLESKLEELAESNQSLTNMQDQLVQSAKMSSLGQLVAGVAHELNNPIAFIYSNMVQMRQYLKNIEELDAVIRQIKEKCDDPTKVSIERTLNKIEWDYIRGDMKDIVQSCLEGSVRVKDIVLGLRNFSRLDKGEIVESDLNESLKNTAKLLGGQLKNRVSLDWDLCDNGLVRCNLSQMNQVFMNLLANAAQAIEGEGTVFIKTWNVQIDGGEYFKIQIKDTGTGMTPEVLRKIFDPFFTTKSVGEGTGLGLSIVYGIVDKHSGRIEVRSSPYPDPMHGTTFEITLPKFGAPVDTSLDSAS